jgi:hypothetical protein
MTRRTEARYEFNLGDKVAWTSQSAGSTLTKVGEIVEVVPARHLPTQMSKDKVGMYRDHESYVVRAIPMKNSNRSSKLYWPRANKLAPYNPEESINEDAG